MSLTNHPDDHDRTKKYVTSVGTTEQRIRFHEVELQHKNSAPQLPPRGRGKAKEKDKGSVIDTEATSTAQNIDRMTGLTDGVGRSREGKAKAKRRKNEVSRDGGAGVVMDVNMDDGEGLDGVGSYQMTVMDAVDVAED
jgi:hypothetical protein